MSIQSAKKTIFRPVCRLLSLLLAVCLLPALPLTAGAEMMERGNLFGSTLFDLGDSIHSVALVGDTLYIRTYQSLYSYGPGDEKAVKRADLRAGMNNYTSANGEDTEEPRIGTICADGDRLLGLDNQGQTLYTLTLKGEKLVYSEPVKLDLGEFMEGEPPYVYMREASWMKVFDGRLFMRFQNYEDLEVDLVSFDLATGEKQEHKTKHLQSAAAYKEGTLIAIQADPNNRFDEQAGKMRPMELVQFNPKDDSITALGELSVGDPNSNSFPDLWYDAQSDSLFTYTDTDIYRLEGGLKNSTLIGYLPMMDSMWHTLPGGLQAMPGDRLAISFGNNVFIRPRTEKGKEGITVLTMSGSIYDDGSLNRTLMELDDIVLRRVEGVEYNMVNAEQLAAMFLTGNVTVDLMAVNVYGFDLDKLIAKGYLADLSDSPAIAAYLDTIAPNLRRSFMVDSKIFAVPGNIVLFPVSAGIKAFKDLGLAYPTSIGGIVEVAEKWMDGLYKEHPEYVLFSSGNNLKDTLLELVITKYIANKLGAGEELVFDTPVFRDLMQRIEQIDWQGFDREIDWSDQNQRSEMEEFWQKKPLLTTNTGFEPRFMAQQYMDEDRAGKVLLLPLEEGQEAHQDADFSLLVVTSSSKNQEAAKRFIEQFIAKQHPVDRAALNLEAKEAIPNPNYERDLETFAAHIASMEQQLKKAEGAEKSNLEESLKQTKEFFETRKERGKFLATEQDLEMIHEVVSRLFIKSGLANAQTQAFGSNYDLRHQYSEGVITLDQFIKQMDDKLRLVRMEYN